jgi:hypothetical protein
VTVLVTFGAAPSASAHSPIVDATLTDWCLGAPSNVSGRVEDSGATLTCGNCSTATNLACKINSDCPSPQTCVNLTSRTETVWWDNRTDGAVNDLATVGVTQDNTNLYFSAGLWVDPDPVSLPFGQIAIDYKPGGLSVWHDPNGLIKAPGRCSVSTDRACTSNADCQFCAISTEPAPSTRVRACGSGCNPDLPGDVCQTNQTCVDMGAGGFKREIGLYSTSGGQADYMLAFDFSLWLIGAGDAVLLMEPDPAAVPVTPWRAVTGAQCPPTGICDFPPAVDPGASGGSGGPPGKIEVAIPWSAFGCTGCPAACVCPGFGPNKPFRFTMSVSRGNLSLDFKPDGALEDVMSEAVAGTTTTTTTNCPGVGIGTTSCELANASSDAFIPKLPALPHETAAGGRVVGLTSNKGAGSTVVLNWAPSCSTGDTNYEVYEGTLGSWYSHLPVNCLTGATTLTFTPGAGSVYHLVVPTNGTTEGSYGRNSSFVQRPASASACVAQSIGTCP